MLSSSRLGYSFASLFHGRHLDTEGKEKNNNILPSFLLKSTSLQPTAFMINCDYLAYLHITSPLVSVSAELQWSEEGACSACVCCTLLWRKARVWSIEDAFIKWARAFKLQRSSQVMAIDIQICTLHHIRELSKLASQMPSHTHDPLHKLFRFNHINMHRVRILNSSFSFG
mmetsp:Transcript_16941/g.28002  ORF Transcript_16941/g.28002 Transcript_16941/m.28002 type:complete len:171 (-) Transcript_16941:508-1020(-)